MALISNGMTSSVEAVISHGFRSHSAVSQVAATNFNFSSGHAIRKCKAFALRESIHMNTINLTRCIGSLSVQW